MQLLEGANPRVKVLAGGQSLLPAMNFRLARFDILVDLNRLADLAYIRRDGKLLRIGAMTRQRDIEFSSEARRWAPLLVDATKSIAHLPIRSRGTIGGSAAHADPAAEYPAVLLALDAVLVLKRSEETRRIPASAFFQGPFSTALRPDELLVEVELPVARGNEAFAFDEVSRRKGDFAIVGVAATLSLSDERIIGEARIAACGVGDVACRLHAAEEVLAGKKIHARIFSEAAVAAVRSTGVRGDLHADAHYRERLLYSLVERVTARSAQRALEHNGR